MTLRPRTPPARPAARCHRQRDQAPVPPPGRPGAPLPPAAELILGEQAKYTVEAAPLPGGAREADAALLAAESGRPTAGSAASSRAFARTACSSTLWPAPSRYRRCAARQRRTLCLTLSQMAP